MKPVEFPGVNVVFAKDQPEYMPLPAMKIPNDPQGLIITKWQLSPEELERVKETGTIHLSMLTFNQPLQPVLLTVDLPTENNKVMDKETYVKRMAELAEIKQKALEYNRKEREKAAESYMTENCPFKKGDTIRYNGKPGKIEVIKAEHNGNFSYEVRFDKKDGTPSVRGTSVYPLLKIDKMEKE